MNQQTPVKRHWDCCKKTAVSPDVSILAALHDPSKSSFEGAGVFNLRQVEYSFAIRADEIHFVFTSHYSDA